MMLLNVSIFTANVFNTTAMSYQSIFVEILMNLFWKCDVMCKGAWYDQLNIDLLNTWLFTKEINNLTTRYYLLLE